MPLRSTLFASDKALQQCLVSDAAHVTPGSRGDHVMRIQSALVRVRALSPADAATGPGIYGPKTAAAVLTFKRAFGIVNRSYQKEADDIVGKMTIAALDALIFAMDGNGGPPRNLPFLIGPHPQPPTLGAASAPVRAASAFAAVSARGAASSTAGARAFAPAPLVTGGGGGFTGTLAGLHPEIQATVRRTNQVKKAGKLMLFPFVGAHEPPLDEAELSKRFDDPVHVNTVATLRDLAARMRPFGLWSFIDTITNVYGGVGSRGIGCEPTGHDAFQARMEQLCTGPTHGPDPNVVPLSIQITDSSFCRDMFNVHGPRTSYREIVNQGPGLHMCITQPGARTTHPCDLHIDEIQQGQVCSKGSCIPLVNGQTIDHLITVGPWLIEDALKKLKLPPFLPGLLM